MKMSFYLWIVVTFVLLRSPLAWADYYSSYGAIVQTPYESDAQAEARTDAYRKGIMDAETNSQILREQQEQDRRDYRDLQRHLGYDALPPDMRDDR